MKTLLIYLLLAVGNIPAIVRHEWWGFFGLGFTIGIAIAHLIMRMSDHA